MTKIQKNLALLGAMGAVGLGAVVYAIVGVAQPLEAEQEKKEQEAKLFTFDKSKVKKVRLLAQGATVEVEKQGDVWAVVAPVKVDADKAVVDALIDKMLELKASRWLDIDEKNQKHFGLESPLQVATVELEGGAKHTVNLGATNAFDQSIYVRREGDPRAAMVDSGARYPFDKSLFDVREKRVLVFEDKDVKQVQVSLQKDKGKPNEYTLVKEGDKWALAKPIQGAADETTVNQVLSTLRNLRASSFVAEEVTSAELKKRGLDKPRGRVVVTMAADSAQKTLDLSRVEEGGAKHVYAKRGEASWVAEVSANTFGDLDKDLFALRDKSVVKFEREKLSRVEFVAQDGAALTVKRAKVKKEGQSWEEEEFTLTAPKEGPAKKFKVSSLLYTLASAKATAFVAEPAPAASKDLAKYGLDKPWSAAFYEGDTLVGKLLVAKKDGKVYAMAEGGPRVVELESRILDEWPKSVEDFAEPPPAPPPASDGSSAGAAAAATAPGKG